MTGLCLRSWLIVWPLLLVAVLSGSTAAREAASNDRNHSGFTVVGVSLGMDFQSALKIYPTATTERAVANCHRYGQAISLPAHTRQTLRHHYKAGTLTLDFEPPSAGGGLSRIHYDRPVESSAGGFSELLDRLSAQYGPHDRILYRRKMEPAARIVGFEWYDASGATLRIVLRNGHANSNDGIRMSILALSTARAQRPKRRTLASLCRKP